MPTLQEITSAADSIAKLIGIVVPAIGPFRMAIVALSTLYTSRRPQREDGTAWSDEEVSHYIANQVADLAANAAATRQSYEALLARRRLRRD